MNAKDLIIVGAGGFAREARWVADCLSENWRVIGFLDDSGNEIVDDLPVLGKINDASKFPKARFLIAIGDPRTRRAIQHTLTASCSPRYATLIHPDAHIGHKVVIGDGSIVTAGCILTTNISLGLHNIINLNTTIGHDVVTGNFCTMAPMVATSGNVRLGNGVEVGTGAAIRQGVIVGSGAVIGMSACVIRGVDADSIVVGNPGRVMKTHERIWSE